MSNSPRDSIKKAILDLGPLADGDVPGLAIQLSSRFQQSGMTLQMIEEAIRRVQAAEGAVASA